MAHHLHLVHRNLAYTYMTVHAPSHCIYLVSRDIKYSWQTPTASRLLASFSLFPPFPAFLVSGKKTQSPILLSPGVKITSENVLVSFRPKKVVQKEMNGWNFCIACSHNWLLVLSHVQDETLFIYLPPKSCMDSWTFLIACTYTTKKLVSSVAKNGSDSQCVLK